LDRTNVVQSLIGKEILQLQLKQLGITSTHEKLSHYPQFEYVWKHMWANNGDQLSVQYSGTGALKSDFTRTGKRTVQGLVQDGKNSAIRYFLNNFKDGTRQDAFDLFLGNYVIDPEASPFKSNTATPLRIIYIGILLVGALMFTFSLFDPSDSHIVYKVGVVIFWLVGLFAAWKTLLYYGNELVNRPSLISH